MDFTLETGVGAAEMPSAPAETAEQRRLRWKPNQDQMDLLSARLGEIPADEQALVRALYLDGKPSPEIASLSGSEARSVRRRARRIAERMLSDEFVFVLRTRNFWPAKRRRLASAVFVRGLPIKQAAKKLRISYYEARREHRILLGLFDASCAGESRGGRVPFETTEASGAPARKSIATSRTIEAGRN
jgi:hypothetical protein